MAKLITDKGRWAVKDNSMIFGKVVWLSEGDEKYYHLIEDETTEEIKIKNIKDYLYDKKFDIYK